MNTPNTPYNPTTGAAYGGMANVSALVAAMAGHNWSSGQFAGFWQWLGAGRAVRKGEHGTRIMLIVDKKDTENPEKKHKVAKTRVVFAFEQTEPAATPEDRAERRAEARMS